MRSRFVFNGRGSDEFGLTIENLPESIHAMRRGEIYQIEGRNGDFVREDGTYDNYVQPYQVWSRNFETGRDAYQNGRDIAAWLIGSSGYCRLEDTYEPEHFRLARFAGPIEVQSILRQFGRATLEFDCRPERFMKSGAVPVTLLNSVDLSNATAALAATKTVTNNSPFTAKPIIRVSGSGNVGFVVENDVDYCVIEIAFGSNTNFVVEIDCETYSYNVAPEIISIGPSFPTLPSLRPGNTTFSALPYMTDPGTLNTLQIIPRWWEI